MPEYEDPTKYLGNMQNHQKMYDFKRDILRVKNPLQDDFTFVYDQLPITITAGGTRDMERYLVEHYIKEMIGHIYNTFAAAKIENAVESFRRTHPDVLDDPYLLNEQIYLKIPRADDPSFQKKVVDDCVVGVVKKYGSDRQLPRQVANQGQLDKNTALYQTLIDGFKTIVNEEPKQEASKVNPTQALG